MTSSESRDGSLLPLGCEHLIFAGFPGSGKRTLASRVARIAATKRSYDNQYVPWAAASAFDFHTTYGKTEVRKGNLLRSAAYWERYFETYQSHLDFLMKLGQRIVLSGTFLTRSLRRKAVALGRKPDGRSSTYVVWLDIAPEVAKQRLTRRFGKDKFAYFQADWLDDYVELSKFPRATEEPGKDCRLLRTDEKNVFILDAGVRRIDHKTNFVFNGVPGLKDARVRVNPLPLLKR